MTLRPITSAILQMERENLTSPCIAKKRERNKPKIANVRMFSHRRFSHMIRVNVPQCTEPHPNVKLHWYLLSSVV